MGARLRIEIWNVAGFRNSGLLRLLPLPPAFSEEKSFVRVVMGAYFFLHGNVLSEKGFAIGLVFAVQNIQYVCA